MKIVTIKLNILWKQEGVAVGRSFAMMKGYQIDGNKEMIAFGTMNIIGSCTSCYLTTGIYIHIDNFNKLEIVQLLSFFDILFR